MVGVLEESRIAYLVADFDHLERCDLLIALVPRRADPLVAVDGGDLASGVGNRGTNVAGNFEAAAQDTCNT